MIMYQQPKHASLTRLCARQDRLALALALAGALAAGACGSDEATTGASHDLAAPDGTTKTPRSDETYEVILAEAGTRLMTSDHPRAPGVTSEDLGQGTHYIRHGNVIAKVVVSAAEVTVRTYVRGGGSARHAVNITAQCEHVPHFRTSKELSTGDTVIARCTAEYPVTTAVVGLLDLSQQEQADQGNVSTSAADTFEEILAEAGDKVLSHNLVRQAGSHTGMMQRGTAYLLDGDVIAKVVVTATETTVRSYVRGGGRAPHGVVITTTCELVRPFTVDKQFEYGDVLVSRCAADYPVINTYASLESFGDPSAQTTESEEREQVEPSEGDASRTARIDSFDEIIAAAGDDLIVNDVPGSSAGAHTERIERGTAYLRDGDVAAKVVVSATEVRVTTFVKDGMPNRHHVFISSACELTPHYYKEATFEGDGELVARCPADYPMDFGAVSLGDIPDDI